MSCLLMRSQEKESCTRRPQGRAAVAPAVRAPGDPGRRQSATPRGKARSELGGGSLRPLPPPPESSPPPGCASAPQLRRRRIPLPAVEAAASGSPRRSSGPPRLGEPERGRTPGPGSAGSSARSWCVPGAGRRERVSRVQVEGKGLGSCGETEPAERR